MAAPFRPSPWALLWTAVIICLLGAGAIALERPAGTLEGVVLSEETHQPLAEAKVRLSGPVSRTAKTGPDGRYRFFNLPVGDYYASASGQRYSAQYQENAVAVAEGKTTDHVDFSLSRLSPEIEVASYQRVYTPEETVRVNLRGVLTSEVAVGLYKLKLDRLLARRDSLDALKKPDVEAWLAAGWIEPVKSWTQPLPPSSGDEWFYQPIQMPSLPQGAYLTTYRGTPEAGSADAVKAPLARTFWFSVSRLGLVTKRADNALLAYTVDLVDHRPVPGAALTIYGERGALASVRTDASGLARLAPPAVEGPVLVAARSGEAIALARANHYGDSSPYMLYGYTDRPVYRPGQTVHYKSIVRAQSKGVYAEAVGATGKLVARDAMGAVLAEREFVLGASSTTDGDLTLPAEAPLGDYQLEFSIGKRAYQTVGFKVADYRKPEFKVEVTPAKPRYAMGEQAEIAVAADYYFGAPVPAAKLQVTVYSAPRYSSYDAAEGFYAGYLMETPDLESFWGYGDVVQQLEGQTDERGRFRFRMPIARPDVGAEGWKGDRTYTVVVEAIDASGRPVKGRQSFLVSQGDFRLEASADQSLYTGGQKPTVTLKATTYEDRPVATQVDVRFVRLETVEKTSAEGDEYTETKRVEAYRTTAQTGADGLARVTAPALPTGDYEITATAHDGAGRSILAQSWAWVADERFAGSESRTGGLQIVLDKKLYRPGDVAKALVVSPVAGASALVTIEGRSLGNAQVVRMRGHTAVVAIPVTEAFKPNAFVAAAIVYGKEFMSTSRSLNVLPEDKFLQVAIKPNKQRYEPGEQATYVLETRDAAGRPVAADVSLGVVDEAIYAIEPESTPDIRAAFYGPSWNMVETSYSFVEDYSGGLDKNAPDPRVRAKFEDTAAWYPHVKTDASGRASVTFTLPDNLTTWIATARAATPNTRVGSATNAVVATKDLLVRLEVPRFLNQGDEADVSAIAHNYTDRPQEVDLQLALTGLVSTASPTQHLTIPPGDAKRVRWPVTTPTLGTALVRVSARGQTASDAMELPVPVLPFGVEAVTATSGSATAAAPGTGTVELPAHSVPGTPSLAVQLSPTPVGAIRTAIAYLHQYPYGCVEQTMSRFLPDLAIAPRMASLGVPMGELFVDSTARSEEGLRRLLSMQHGDGGWGWWATDESQVEMTAYVLEGLAEARKAGLNVPDDAARRAIDYLQRMLPKIGADAVTRTSVKRGAGPDQRAFALYGLAAWSAAPTKELDRLWQGRTALSHFGTAQFTLALALSGDGRAASSMDTLWGQSTASGSAIWWTSAAPQYSWQDDDVETTAYALLAGLRIDANDARLERVARWLVSRNQRGYWMSTKDTGRAAIALTRYMAARGVPSVGAWSARVLVNDQPVATASPDASAPWDAPAPIAVPEALLRPGANAVRVELTGAGSLDWSARARAVETAEHLAAAPGSGMKLTREYFRLPADVYAKAQGAGGFGAFYDDKVVASLSRLGDRVRIGERVLVRVTLESEKALNYMALKDPLPAGCEVLENPPSTYQGWWDHQEYRDEEVVFFFTQLPVGRQRFYYVMRPTTAGSFHVAPSTAFAMYLPEVRARGADAHLTIAE